MANGLLSDWMSGTGVYGSPNAIDPSTGVPYADVRAAQLGALGNIGSLLIAAGQPMTGAQRAQLLGQIGPQLSGMQTDIYNAAQRRLMQAQFQDQMAARASRTALAEEAKADPLAFEKKYGFNPTGLSSESISSLVTKMKESEVMAGPERKALASLFGDSLTGTTVSPEMALSGGEGPTVSNAAKIGTTVRPDLYNTLMSAGTKAISAGTPTYFGIGQKILEVAKGLEPKITTVAPGATVIDPTGKKIYQAEEKAANTPDIINYNFEVAQDIAAGRTPKTFPEWLAEERKSKGGNTINIDTKSELGNIEAARKAAVEMFNAGNLAVKDQNQINQIRQLLDEGAITGFGTGAIMYTNQAAKALGFTDENDPRLPNTAAIISTLSRRALTQSEKLKGTASEKDMQLILRAAGGDANLSEAEIRRILDLTTEVNSFDIQQGQRAADALERNDFKGFWKLAETKEYKQKNIQRVVPDPNDPNKNISVKATREADGNFYTVIDGKKYRIEE